MQKALIVANWKMHKTQKETVEFLEELSKSSFSVGREVWIASSFTSLVAAEKGRERLKLPLFVGAQNVSEHPQGAFTGEVSAAQLADVGVRFVIIGHSERRHFYGETNLTIKRKIEQVVSEKMIPLLCVGESEKEREEGIEDKILEGQIRGALEGFSDDFLEGLVVAYEPVWAIGTGKVATPEMANGAHGIIRETLIDLFGQDFGKSTPILYGGSVKPEWMVSLMEQIEINGVLVGGASLSADSFKKIINY
jgi:triosephosphate isomerase